MKTFSFTTAQLGKQLFYYESCDSTNRQAATLLGQGDVRPGAVVFADFQTAGRGQQQNQWESQAGDNLTFSVIIFPHLPVQQQFWLTILVSLAVADGLQPFLKDRIQIKWPNDIFYQDHKLGGILIQNTLQHASIRTSVIGIGLNINQTHFSQPRAVSLAMIRQQVLPREQILNQVLLALEERLSLLHADNHLSGRAQYESRLYGKGQKRVFESGGDRFEGKILGIEPDGRLRVEVADQIRTFDFHDIKYHWGAGEKL